MRDTYLFHGEFSMSTTGPSHYAEVSNFTFTPTGGSAINIYSIGNIRRTRDLTIVTGKDNNKLRAVSTHVTEINETVTADCDDIAAMINLEPYAGTPGVLAFTWIKSQNQLNGSALANQSVSIAGLVWKKVDTDAVSKGMGKGSLSGFTIEVSGDGDPVSE
jgi:hypothetical protein